MPLDEPAWWYRPGQTPAIARVLRPASNLYAWAVERRFRKAKPHRSALPVICIGNLTAGGTGKTPLAIHIAERLIELGERPAFLTRGYGGRIRGPHWVDPQADAASDVGDEPLLLARVAPVLLSRDRAAGARAIEAAGTASVIVMDDGLQNPSLVKDLTLALVDARRGVGNGEVLPAGPLRAPLAFQLGLVNAIVLNHPPGGNCQPDLTWLQHPFTSPVLKAAPEPKGDDGWINGARLIAYAGIANPQRFFGMLEQLGAHLAATVALPDHHTFRAKDAERILALAALHDAVPVTTEKDFVRLAGGKGPIAELEMQSRTLGIRLALDAPSSEQLMSLLRTTLARPRRSEVRW